jgi:hypothetical protein
MLMSSHLNRRDSQQVTFVTLICFFLGLPPAASVKLMSRDSASDEMAKMEILTPRPVRRSTRLRVEIPVTVTSLDRKHPFSARCMALVVSPQGCGVRASQALPLETPILLNDLPGGGSASARVATCLPLGNDKKHFLIGVALYNQANVWGITNPPEDWNCASNLTAAVAAGADKAASKPTDKAASKSGNAWPYNLFSGQGESHPGRK